jgi:hypothetical protein
MTRRASSLCRHRRRLRGVPLRLGGWVRVVRRRLRLVVCLRITPLRLVVVPPLLSRVASPTRISSRSVVLRLMLRNSWSRVSRLVAHLIYCLTIALICAHQSMFYCSPSRAPSRSISVPSSLVRAFSSTTVSALSLSLPSTTAKSVPRVSAGKASRASGTTTWLVVATSRSLQCGLFSFVWLPIWQ